MTLVEQSPGAGGPGLQHVDGGRPSTGPVVIEPLRRIPRVLVVDDDPATAVVVRTVLGRGAAVVGIPDVYQALDQLESERFDLLLLEIFLPGAGGADLLRRLGRGIRPTSVVVLTHAANVSRLAPGVSVDAVLHKPPGAEALRSLLAAAVADEPVR